MKDIPAIRIERRFEAPVAAVYQAWTEADKMARWMWGSLTRDGEAEADVRPGGRYDVTTARKDGSRWSMSGTYSDVVPNERLVYSVEWSAPMGYESSGETVTVTFASDDGGTKVVFVHEGVPGEDARAEHLRGWSDTFDALRALVEP